MESEFVEGTRDDFPAQYIVGPVRERAIVDLALCDKKELINNLLSQDSALTKTTDIIIKLAHPLWFLFAF